MDPTNGTPLIPASPDPRTGLIRVNLGNRMGSFDRWWIAGSGRAVVWHNLKTNEVSHLSSSTSGKSKELINSHIVKPTITRSEDSSE